MLDLMIFKKRNSYSSRLMQSNHQFCQYSTNCSCILLFMVADMTGTFFCVKILSFKVVTKLFDNHCSVSLAELSTRTTTLLIWKSVSLFHLSLSFGFSVFLGGPKYYFAGDTQHAKRSLNLQLFSAILAIISQYTGPIRANGPRRIISQCLN